VSWTLIEGNLLKAMNGSYVLKPNGAWTGDLHVDRRHQHAHDLDVQAQGGEDDHRQCAQGPQE
jgi:hypothetical protein